MLTDVMMVTLTVHGLCSTTTENLFQLLFFLQKLSKMYWLLLMALKVPSYHRNITSCKSSGLGAVRLTIYMF